jgi:hypothetical protein
VQIAFDCSSDYDLRALYLGADKTRCNGVMNLTDRIEVPNRNRRLGRLRREKQSRQLTLGTQREHPWDGSATVIDPESKRARSTYPLSGDQQRRSRYES